MKARQYSGAILQALKRSQSDKFKKLEDLRDRIVSTMEEFEEMLSDGAIILTPTETPKVNQTLVSDLSERVMPAAEPPHEISYEEQLQKNPELKQNAIANYTARLPGTLLVQPPGFKEPIVLKRLAIENSPGSLPFIRVKYAPEGSTSDAETVIIPVNVTDAVPEPETMTEMVSAQARGRYLTAPKSITSSAPPHPSSLEAQLQGSPHAETDADTPSKPPESWLNDISTPLDWKSKVSH